MIKKVGKTPMSNITILTQGETHILLIMSNGKIVKRKQGLTWKEAQEEKRRYLEGLK